MVKGFKDDSGKFHPIGQRGVSKNSRKSRVRYSNGASLLLDQSIRDFARNRKEAYKTYKANQEEKFNRELEMRRRFQGKLIVAFRQARAQNVKQGRDLEKFIRQQIPDLPKEKGIEKFVQNVLRDFVKQEARLEKEKKGKSEVDKKALQDAFDDSLTRSKATFEKIQSEQDIEFAKEQKKQADKNQKNIQKLEKEAKQADDARKQLEKDVKEAQEKQTKEATEKAEQSAKKVDKEEKDEATFANEVAQELKEDKQELKTEDFSFGFPEEIV